MSDILQVHGIWMAPHRYDQTFRIDHEGTLSVLKFGHIVSRGTNDVIRLNGTIVDKE